MLNESPRVTIVSVTEFRKPPHIPWTTDAIGGQAVVEFAGRACYQSWSKPNADTANNRGYIRNIKDHRHFSVLEHGNIGIYFEGISRTLSHELIRHRHFSYSELSQRYVNMEDAVSIMHPTLAQFAMEKDFERIRERIDMLADTDTNLYEDIIDYLEEKKISGKKAREAARGIMPANLETKIIVTGNYRAWRHWLVMRASEHADAEIRNLALEVFAALMEEAPNIFDDFDYVFDTSDGRIGNVIGLSSPYMEIS